MREINQRMAILCFVVVWSQFSIAPLLTVDQVAPDFIFLLFSFFVFYLDKKKVMFWAFGVGLVRDLLSNTYFGLETISLVTGVLVLYQIAARFDTTDQIVQLWSTFLGAFSGMSIFLLFLCVIQNGNWIEFAHVMKGFFIAVYTTALVFFIFPVLKAYFGVRTQTKQYELF